MSRVIWCQRSHQGVRSSVEELRWRSVVENPMVANLITATQFMQQSNHTPHLVNDIVFNGTSATHQDYQHCSKIINSLPNLRRLAIVNAHPIMFTINMNVKFHITDLAIRSCNMSQLPSNLIAGMVQLCSLDLTNNLLVDLGLFNHTLHRSFSLRLVNMSKNKFSNIPTLLTTMPNLTYLNMSSNCLSELDGKDFQHLVQLQELNISNNSSITAIPSAIIDLPLLQNLRLTGLLSLKRPSYELAKKGLTAVRQYYAKHSARGWLIRSKSLD